MEQTHLSQSFWEFGIINDLETSSINNNAYTVYLASQCNSKAPAFLSKTMTISSLIEQRGDIHHIFPKDYLTKNNFVQKQYNQVANFVYTEQSTNIKVGNLPPFEYMAKLRKEIENGVLNISTIDNSELIVENLSVNDIPELISTATYHDYDVFLAKRRKLMASKIEEFYKSL